MFNGSYLRACSNQMVNTRHGSDQQQGQNNQGTGIPMPPPLTPEQYFQLQMYMMAEVPEQHCSGTSAGSHAASASSTTTDPRHACGVVQKIRFWGINNKSSTSCHWFLCFGTRPRRQTRAPWLGPPRLKKAKSNFSKTVISYTLLRVNH